MKKNIFIVLAIGLMMTSCKNVGDSDMQEDLVETTYSKNELIVDTKLIYLIKGNASDREQLKSRLKELENEYNFQSTTVDINGDSIQLTVFFLEDDNYEAISNAFAEEYKDIQGSIIEVGRLFETKDEISEDKKSKIDDIFKENSEYIIDGHYTNNSVWIECVDIKNRKDMFDNVFYILADETY